MVGLARLSYHGIVGAILPNSEEMTMTQEPGARPLADAARPREPGALSDEILSALRLPGQDFRALVARGAPSV